MPSRTRGLSTTIDRAQHTVLVIDDNPSTRYSTSRVIRAAGFKTLEAGTGAEGIGLASKGVSAVVLDVHLPDMNGFEVCGVLRHDPETALVPVIHLSATFVENEDKVAGLDAGADAYLVHPVEPTVLVATLQALIRARMAEDRLRRSDVRFRAIYNQAHSGIALIDAEGRFADVNPALADLLGRPREDLIGRPVADFAADDVRAFVREKTSVAGAADVPWTGEFPLLRADGTVVHLEWNLSSPIEPGLRVAIAVDGSERIRLERQRQELFEREQAARVVAERHSRTKDDFVAVLSHELRTPLNAIVGWVHVLMHRGAPPEMMKGLEAIDRNARAQARIISDILDVSRINSGKLGLDRELVDPAELVTTSIASLRKSLDDKKLQIEGDFAQAREPAWLDPTRFQQIFWNLMTNAIKFSAPGGIIRIGLQRTGDQLTLVIRDFGQGIKAEFIGKLFDRFSQSDAPGNRFHGGLGLGLSIVKHLAELHGGTVTAESDGLGKGTTMRVELPVGTRAEPTTEARPGRSSVTATTPTDSEETLAGLSILVVEDDVDASDLLRVVLRDRGARVRVAADVGAALSALDEAWPDILVSDIGLPGRDGYALMREVRELATARGLSLPSIALTAFSREQDRKRALEAGFSAFLGKPLRPHHLVNAILTLCGRDSARSKPAWDAR